MGGEAPEENYAEYQNNSSLKFIEVIPWSDEYRACKLNSKDYKGIILLWNDQGDVLLTIHDVNTSGGVPKDARLSYAGQTMLTSAVQELNSQQAMLSPTVQGLNSQQAMLDAGPPSSSHLLPWDVAGSAGAMSNLGLVCTAMSTFMPSLAMPTALLVPFNLLSQASSPLIPPILGAGTSTDFATPIPAYLQNADELLDSLGDPSHDFGV